jgi:hypothetical protein
MNNSSSQKLLPTRQVCARYDVCFRTIGRWERNPDLNFPQPVMINRRKYYPEAALIEWDRARVRGAV